MAQPTQPEQLDLFRGLRMFCDTERRTRLEGTVRLASKYTGLAPRTIHDYIEDGEIASRQPGRNRLDGEELNKAGRRRNHKCLVDMSDVWRIAYGKVEAEKLCASLGITPRWRFPRKPVD